MSGSFKKVNFFFKELGNGTLFSEIYIYFFSVVQMTLSTSHVFVNVENRYINKKNIQTTHGLRGVFMVAYPQHQSFQNISKASVDYQININLALYSNLLLASTNFKAVIIRKIYNT